MTHTQVDNAVQKRKIIGNEEWCSLNMLGVPLIKARVDTGARTSALHAFNIRCVEEDNHKVVLFELHPLQNNYHYVKTCKAKLLDIRVIKSSSGHQESRYVIKTPMTMGDDTWEVEITLSNRDTMGYRMLLGREAMNNRFLVDPEKSFCFGDKTEKELKKLYTKPKVCKREGYKILLLASNPNLYSNKRLMEAAEDRGHQIRFVNIEQCYINVNLSAPKVFYRGGEILHEVDAVIPRIRPSLTYYGCVVLRHFEFTGAFCLNTAEAISKSRDKLWTLQVFSEKYINIPVTGFAHSPQDTESVIQMVGGAPLVIKLLAGTQGIGVVLAETRKASESVINAFKSLKANILVQEFVKEAQGKDIRCFVVDGKVVAAFQREAAEGEFRANLHLGGRGSKVKISLEERRIAVKAAKALGLHVAGVDIILSLIHI